MSYESPITIVSELINTQLRQDGDRYVAEIEKKVGFHVDKQELIKALAYDREQYQKGYDDGVRESFNAEIENIKSEIANIEYLSCPQPEAVIDDVLAIIDKHISELKGENNE